MLALSTGMLPYNGKRGGDDAVLSSHFFGRTISNPIGLAAGFDKDAEGIRGIAKLGFALIEVGTVTPLPQPGNAKPRLFRLDEDRAVINRCGFNNEGAKAMEGRLRILLRAPDSPFLLGVNLGRNKSSESHAAAVDDYQVGVRTFAPFADYLVINISSPNTPNLRAMQQREPLYDLIRQVQSTLAESALARVPPLLIKISPDLTDAEKRDVAQVVLDTGVDGIIVCNTTTSRPADLRSANKAEAGGLSGAPLGRLSTEAVRDMYELTGGRVVIIAVGGVGSGADVYEKLQAGASLVQVYSALTFEGPGLVRRMKEDLTRLLKTDGRTVTGTIGIKADQHHRALTASPQ
jgi:dihydroorotate dehydrogenase